MAQENMGIEQEFYALKKAIKRRIRYVFLLGTTITSGVSILIVQRTISDPNPILFWILLWALLVAPAIGLLAPFHGGILED